MDENRPAEPLQATLGFLETLAARRFWGTLTVRFENGRPVHLKKEERTWRVDQLPSNKSGYHDVNIPHCSTHERS